jgi:hypothetical protein
MEWELNRGMTSKIPSSLKWLIDKRARLDGEIKKTRASLTSAKQLIEELSKLEDDLAAIDRSLGLHEIQVEVEHIQPIRSHYVRVKLPHGELTKSILLCLRLREGVPARMTEIVAFIEARHGDLSASVGSREVFHRSVHNRLKNLCREGRLRRHHPLTSNSNGLWGLSDDDGSQLP